MTWPWVARSTADALVVANGALSAHLTSLLSERDYLRAQLAAALDHNRRIERVEAGRPELPVQIRQPREPMPVDIAEAIGAWESQETRDKLEADAYRSYEKHGTWDRARGALSAAE